MQRQGQPIEFHVDAAAAFPSFTAGSLESVWWLPRQTADGWLMLSNSSPEPLKVALTLSEVNGLARSRAVMLAAHGTQRIGLREAVAALGLNGEQGGLTLTTDGPIDALRAAEVLFDETTGFSAMMKVFRRDPSDMAMARTLRAPTVALTRPDPTLGFPSGTALQPYLLVRNASAAPIVQWYNYRGGAQRLQLQEFFPFRSPRSERAKSGSWTSGNS